MHYFRARRTPFALSPAQAVVSYLVLGLWTLVVLFPLYWVIVTSVKLPVAVDSGPFYIPFVDFQPSLHAWRYIFVDLRNDTLRPYANTIIVSLTSTLLAVTLGSVAAYALVRFAYRPKVGLIGLFAGCVVLAAGAVGGGAPWPVAVVSALAIFLVLASTVSKRLRATLGNADIAFWLISQRMLPPVASIIPIYVMFQALRLLDSYTALIITYVAANLPIVVWLMRDYFVSLPLELEECAAIDGASRYRIVWTIVLPLAAPGLVATFLFVLVFAWNEYLLALFLSSSRVQTMPLLVAAQSGTRGTEWWYMSVLIIIMILPVVVLAMILERYISRGLLVGAVKG
jgi:multiple sugar transport system permease protein